MNATDPAQFLWALLDDIDTASDRAKADDKGYRQIVERIQRRRFEVGSTDGYTVAFRSRNDRMVMALLGGCLGLIFGIVATLHVVEGLPINECRKANAVPSCEMIAVPRSPAE